MDWEDLRFFLAAATQQSLAASARELGVSQATVWRHIGQLEDSLQARLFTHKGSGYALSPVGERVLETATRVAQDIETAQRELFDDARMLRGEIRVTCPELLVDLLSANLKVLLADHPALRLELIAGAPVASLARKETDIALRYEAPGENDAVVEKRYGVGFGVYASQAYIREHGRPPALDDFSGHELIGFDDSVGHVSPTRWLRGGGKGANVTFRSNSLRARASAAAAGLGCVLLPSMLGRSTDGLEEIFGTSGVGSLDLHLVVNGHVRNNPRVKAILEYIVKVLDRNSSILLGS